MDMLMMQLMTTIGMVKSLQDASLVSPAPPSHAGNNLIDLSGDVSSTKSSLSIGGCRISTRIPLRGEYLAEDKCPYVWPFF
jgi:hypothetical protein